MLILKEYTFRVTGENPNVNPALWEKQILIELDEEEFTNIPELDLSTAEEALEKIVKSTMPESEGWTSIKTERLT